MKLFELSNRQEIQEKLKEREEEVKEMKDQKIVDQKVQEEQKQIIDDLTQRIKDEQGRHKSKLAEIESRHARLVEKERKRISSEREALANQIALKHAEEMKKAQEKLKRAEANTADSKAFIDYMGKILLLSNSKNEELQQLIELQAASIAEKTETLAEFRRNYRSILTHECFNDNSTISKQAQVIQHQGRWINAVIPLLKYTNIPSHLRMAVERSGPECQLKGILDLQKKNSSKTFSLPSPMDCPRHWMLHVPRRKDDLVRGKGCL